jgi:hypothetical protein
VGVREQIKRDWEFARQAPFPEGSELLDTVYSMGSELK